MKVTHLTSGNHLGISNASSTLLTPLYSRKQVYFFSVLLTDMELHVRLFLLLFVWSIVFFFNRPPTDYLNILFFLLEKQK